MGVHGQIARCRGVTLVELIVTIVIVAIAAGAILAVLSSTAARSAESLVRQQATLIAQSYLDEILEKPFGTTCYPGCTRRQMAKVGDYNRLSDVGVHDGTGNPINTLDAYDVTVTVTNPGLGVAPRNVPGPKTELVEVTVTAADGAQVVLSGYRTAH